MVQVLLQAEQSPQMSGSPWVGGLSTFGSQDHILKARVRIGTPSPAILGLIRDGATPRKCCSTFGGGCRVLKEV